MRKKGFTLIELLAVIVILAIIALIATPIVMNVIENSRKGAAERSAENYLKAVETAVGTERIDGRIMAGEYTITDKGNLCPGSVATCTDEEEIKIEMSGNKPSAGGTIKIVNGQVVTTSQTTMTIGDYTVNYNSDGKLEATKNGESSGEGNERVVYRWSSDSIAIGDPIGDNYVNNSSELGKQYYLRHVLNGDNTVKETHVCIKYSDKDEAVCMKAGSSYFDENSDTLNELNDIPFVCRIRQSIGPGFNSECGYDGYDGYEWLTANSGGGVTATTAEGNCTATESYSFCDTY